MIDQPRLSHDCGVSMQMLGTCVLGAISNAPSVCELKSRLSENTSTTRQRVGLSVKYPLACASCLYV